MPISNYVNITSLSSTLSTYATTNALTSVLSSYVINSQFTTFSNPIPTNYVLKSLFDSTIAAYQLQINSANKLSYNFISGTPDLSIYANISAPTFTSDVKLSENKILYVDSIAPKTTSPTNINYFLENVNINKGLQVSGGLIANSIDIGTNLNVNGNATISGNLNGIPISNYIVNNTFKFDTTELPIEIK